MSVREQAAARSVAEPPGGQRALHRGLKVLGTLMITLSAITPASSVFIIVPGVIGIGGSGALWAFIIAAVVGVFMAFVYAELSSAYPLTGGEYAIVGRTVGGLAGFIVMGLVLVTLLIIIAVIALGVGTYLGVLFPALGAAEAAPYLAAVAVIIAVLLAVLDIKVNAIVTGIFLLIEMLALVAVSVLGFIHVERPITELLLHPVIADNGTLAPVGLAALGVATSVAIFSYNGYGSAVFFGEETQDAHRGIARAILWALVITVAAEIIPLIALLMGATDLAALFAGGPNMVSNFVSELGGTWLNTFVSLGIAIAIFNAVVAIMLLTARLLFSSARDKVWFADGINRALVSIHPRFGTPWISTIVVGIFSVICCFFPLNTLLVITGTSLIAIYAALCIATLTGRSNGSTSHAAYKMPWYPLPPIAGLLIMAYILYINATDPAFGLPSLEVTAIIIVVSAVYYLVVLRPRGTWVLHGPDEKVDTAGS